MSRHKLPKLFKCNICKHVYAVDHRAKPGRNICRDCAEVLESKPKPKGLKCATCGKVAPGYWRGDDKWECIRCLRKRANKTLGDETGIILNPMFRK